MTLKLGRLGLFTSLCACVCACSAAHAPSSEPPRSAAKTGSSLENDFSRSSAPAPVAGESEAPASAAAAPEPLADSEAKKSARPGLGTSWGESITDSVSSTTFVRGDGGSPFATASVFYNDEGGVAAMARGRFVDWTDSVFSVGYGVAVSVTDPNGNPLRAARVDGRPYAVGRDGDRYVIHIDNHSPARLEAVATVDGLDVIDGDDGSLDKRGYVIAPYDTLDIQGFRDSEGSVRAFRFGATDDSYASRRGKGRNVGVIGVALFREYTVDARWTPGEVERRKTADPFPTRFAPAPPADWRAR